jgi:hypothetical protein
MEIWVEMELDRSEKGPLLRKAQKWGTPRKLRHPPRPPFLGGAVMPNTTAAVDTRIWYSVRKLQIPIDAPIPVYPRNRRLTISRSVLPIVCPTFILLAPCFMS